MLKVLQQTSFLSLCALYIGGLSLLTFQFSTIFTPVAYAQSISSFTATLIGGKTKGVTDVCCNGVVLGFSAADKTNIFVLDGDAIFIPGLSNSYLSGNEFTTQYNQLGNLLPSLCVTVESECESAKEIPMVWHIGTSALQGL
jgi:hypothetical protein